MALFLSGKPLTMEPFSPTFSVPTASSTLPAASTHSASVPSLSPRTTREALPGNSLVWAPTPIKWGTFIWAQEFSKLLGFSCYWHFILFRSEERKSCFLSLLILSGHFLWKWGNSSTSDLNLCQTRAPAFCCCFASNLCFPNRYSLPQNYDPLRSL